VEDLKEECKTINEKYKMEVEFNENWIKEFKKKLDYVGTCLDLQLSEKFMETFASKQIEWRLSAIYQKMSPTFIDRHFDKLCITYIIKYQKLSVSWFEQNKSKLSAEHWKNALIYQPRKDKDFANTKAINNLNNYFKNY
jgi:hypothetical protein